MSNGRCGQCPRDGLRYCNECYADHIATLGRDATPLACEVVTPPARDRRVFSLTDLLILVAWIGVVGFIAWRGAQLAGGGW